MSYKLIRLFPRILFNARSYSIRSTCLEYTDYGDPKTVIKKVEKELNKPQNTEVLVKMLASPVNPADINMIQGKYPESPKFPAIGGNEGVGEVIECGPNVCNLKPGDKVIPFTNLLGTWRTHGLFDQTNLYKLPNEIGIYEAATFSVNPPTAYRMLKDFVKLKPGDTIIQNGANSAVGQMVIQLCKIWSINCIGIIRDRPGVDELKEYLKQLGTCYIFTENEFDKSDLLKSGKVKKPKLALNCVGGQSSARIVRSLANKGFHVTYGGMSREPLTIPTSSLIFKDIAFHGFWMSRWNKEYSDDKNRIAMIEELAAWFISGDLKVPSYKALPFSKYEIALENALDIKGQSGTKVILDFICK